MALKSKRFAGDPKLEAAAISDPAHIIRGASGLHVAKIQSALIELDGAVINGQEISQMFYGNSTAGAVLNFKRKRNIINQSYQKQVDDIVGKMTIAAIDNEIAAKESMATSAPPKLVAINHTRQIDTAPVLTTLRARQSFGLNGSTRDPLQLTSPPALESIALDIQENQMGSFRVLNGVGGTLVCDDKIIAISDPGQFISAANNVPVTKNPQVFNVTGLNSGLSTISLFMPGFIMKIITPLVVFVHKKNAIARKFTEGIQHNHPACGKWSEIQQNPFNGTEGSDSGFIERAVVTRVCSGCSTPKCAIDKTVQMAFGDKPTAKDHIDWYLKGNGRDLDEGGNILGWIKTDGGIRRVLKEKHDSVTNKSGKKAGFFEFRQSEYKSKDFQWSFGSIDRVDFEFDFDLQECTIWFQDRYEWHPFYPDLYKEQKGDEHRTTNCLHAAFVEMKLQGAKDYWMKGQNTVPIKTILS